MGIIANHAHLMPPSVEASWWPEGGPDLLLKHLDACGVDRAVVFPPFANQVSDGMRGANLWALEAVSKHADRFIPAGCMFPLADDALEVLHILHAEGVRLVKIHPSIDLHDIAAPEAAQFYAEAEELGMILDYHTGPHGTRLSLATPEKFDDVVWDHPKLKFVFEHLGGRTYFEGFAAILANHREKAFGGLASVFDAEKNWMWHLDRQRVEGLIRCVGAGSFIFGLDFPWNSADRNRRDIETIRSFDITEQDKDLILGGNLTRLLGA